MTLRQSLDAVADGPIDIRDEAHALLDAAAARLERGETLAGMEAVVLGLHGLRARCTAEEWEGLVERDLRRHAILRLLLADPFTRRSFEKPRGYSGDAETLDFVFDANRPLPEISPAGAAILRYTTDGPAPRSLRARAAMIAGTIDALAAIRRPRVLAVMAGHLWEARMSRAVASGGVAKYVAFDQDARTLAAIDAAAPAPCIATYHGTARALLGGRSVFRNFDLVYTGILDNLPDVSARRLLATLFGALAPGGRLIVSNFVPELTDAGYMEAFMDWRLVYRDEAGLLALAEELAAESRKTYRDPHGNMAFLELVRSGENYEC